MSVQGVLQAILCSYGHDTFSVFATKIQTFFLTGYREVEPLPFLGLAFRLFVADPAPVRTLVARRDSSCGISGAIDSISIRLDYHPACRLLTVGLNRTSVCARGPHFLSGDIIPGWLGNPGLESCSLMPMTLSRTISFPC